MNMWRHRLVFLLIAAYAGTGPLLDLLHRDALACLAGGPASVATHGCAGTERHLPLDRIHGCSLCAQSGQRCAVPATPDVPRPPHPCAGESVVPPLHGISAPLLLPADPRGPPAA
jgi:hypothetical protein